jgi:alkylhydroperoxidase family enzyme
MPRLREVPRAEVADECILYFYDHLFVPDRDPAADHGTATGTPGGWWTVFAQDRHVFRHAVRGFALYRNADLDPVLRELGQCRAGWARGSQFVSSQHCKQMRALGMAEEKITSVPHWQAAGCYSPPRTGRARLHRRARPGRRPGARRGIRRPQGAPAGKGDPPADLHHVHVRHARDDVAGAAPGIRQPRQAGRGGGRPRRLREPGHLR